MYISRITEIEAEEVRGNQAWMFRGDEGLHGFESEIQMVEIHFCFSWLTLLQL